MQKINLNYDWQYKASFEEGDLNGNTGYTDFETVHMPHANKILDYNNFDESEYQFVSCYRKKIFIPQEYDGKVILLKFEGIASYSRLYVNGQIVAEHLGGYTPFEADISGNVIFGEENLLTVVCDATERPDIPPFGQAIDYLAYGGIYREVWMEIREKIYIKDIFVRTFDVLAPAKAVDIDIELSQAVEKTGVYFEITDNKGAVVSSFSCEINASNKGKISGRVSNVELWSTENPQLYTLAACLGFGGKENDRVEVRFGFREACFRTDGFYLNGRKLKLTGLNRHQSYPYVGYAMPESAQKKDADILKFELGVNIVRTSHYPQSRHFLDRCDEIGLLIFEEVPGWQHIGQGIWQEIVCRNVHDMILRDRNHPAIILWGVRINESADNDELYGNTNKIAHELDNTRQTGGVRNFSDSHLLEDVYTYNDFIHMGTNAALSLPEKVTGTNAPYLVTEHNGHMFPTKRFDNEEKRLEHALRHMRVMNVMMGSSRISGAIGWCMCDYNTHRDFGSGDRICYHGVADMFRIPKAAWYAYASQQDEIPVLEVSSSMDIGEHPAGDLGIVYAFTNCDYVKLYKNDELIKTFYPDREQFPYLKHPPVKIDDFIGDLLQRHENISEKDSRRLKVILRDASKYGFNLPLGSKLMMGRLMLKYKLSMNDGMRLFGTYVSNWGGKRLSFKFEGYKNNKLVRTVVKSTSTKAFLQVKPDSRVLLEKDTYDVTRIVLLAVDENSNLLTYSNDAVTIETEGPIEVIGPECIALIGGARAFWIKTKGCPGTGTVIIKSGKFGNTKLEFDIRR